MPFELLILFGLAVLNGVFALSEMAVVSARKARLQSLADQGDAGARRTLELLESPERFLSTVQIGVTVIGTVAGVFGGATIAEEISLWIQANSLQLAPYSDAIGALVITLVTVYLSLVIGELVPKRLALQNPERAAGLVARPMQWLSRVAAPLVYFLGISSEVVIRLLGVKPQADTPVTEGEVLTMIEQGIEGGIFEPEEQQMVQGVFALDARHVREIMTPRPDIVWLDITDTCESMQRKLADSVYSAYPVCRERIEDVVGVVHSRNLVPHILAGGTCNLQSIMQPPLFIPETVTVSGVVTRFKEAGIHIALIVGEDGGVEGLVTLNDIVEEILGDVNRNMPQSTLREDGTWLIDGYMPIIRFATMFPDIELPENEMGEYQSVAGFVLARLGHIPSATDHFEWHGYYFEVVDMDGVRVDKILVSKLPQEEVSEE